MKITLLITNLMTFWASVLLLVHLHNANEELSKVWTENERLYHEVYALEEELRGDLEDRAEKAFRDAVIDLFPVDQ